MYRFVASRAIRRFAPGQRSQATAEPNPVRGPVLQLIPDPNLRVAIIGRPNVGKSTLFNRLVGQRVAVVHPEAGVTRDCNEHAARLLDLTFTAIDTPGQEEAEVMKHTADAVRSADVSLLLVDVKEGVQPQDHRIAQWLKKKKAPTALVLNKCDNMEGDISEADRRALDCGPAWRISALSGLGLHGIYQILRPVYMAREKRHDKLRSIADMTEEDEQEQEQEQEENDYGAPLKPMDPTGEGEEAEEVKAARLQKAIVEGSIHLAIVGKANVGKSTLFNKLIGKDASLVSPIPGTTRDTIELRCSYGMRRILLADTAGLRKQKILRTDLLGFVQMRALHTVRIANVVLLVVDGTVGISGQDIDIARMAAEEGRCLVVAVNKWDIVPQQDHLFFAERLQNALESGMGHAGAVTCVVCSAEQEKNLELIVQKCVEVYDRWNTLLPDDKLQRFLQKISNVTNTGTITSLRQLCARPPTFIVTQRRGSKKLPHSLKQSLANRIRKQFRLDGTPIRIIEEAQPMRRR